MIKWSFILIFGVLSANLLTGQRPSYFLGKQNMAGVDCNFSLSQVIADKGVNKVPLLYGFRFERILNKGVVAGVSLSHTRFDIADEFKNEGRNYNYYINYNDLPRNVNNGKGDMAIRSNAIFLHCKQYRYNRTTVPVGGFLAVRAGVSFNRIKIAKDYQFTFTQYYGPLRKDYVTSDDQYLNFRKIHIGLEYGKTVRCFNDRLFFTYSLLALLTTGNKFDEYASLNDRFLFVAEKKIIQNKALTLNLGLSYVF